MQTIDKTDSNLVVVAFNPSLKLSKEKQALQLIIEHKEIREMADDMNKVKKLENWRVRALALAAAPSTRLEQLD